MYINGTKEMARSPSGPITNPKNPFSQRKFGKPLTDPILTSIGNPADSMNPDRIPYGPSLPSYLKWTTNRPLNNTQLPEALRRTHKDSRWTPIKP